MELSKIHRMLEGMSGLWSSAETLHNKNRKNRHVESKTERVAVFEYFSDQIFCNDFTTKFLNKKTLLRGHTGANVSPAKLFEW